MTDINASVGAGGEWWTHWHTAAPPCLPDCLSTQLIMTDAPGCVPRRMEKVSLMLKGQRILRFQTNGRNRKRREMKKHPFAGVAGVFPYHYPVHEGKLQEMFLWPPVILSMMRILGIILSVK